MTPGARLQAAIDLLDAIDRGDTPADRIVARWGRASRFAGGGDRRAVRDLVYHAIRRRRQIEWWVERFGEAADGRMTLIVVLSLILGWDAATIAAAFGGGRYDPSPMTVTECHLLDFITGVALDDPAQPLDVRCNVPEWLLPRLAEAFGDETEAALAALARQAPTDLRVNTLKADRPAALKALAEDGIEAAETPHSPLGLRLAARRPLAASRAWRDGLVEVQDEGSQIVALIVDARPGQRVADYCAGAGGKALALAAAMANEGRIVACDTAASRLRRGRERLRRAGVAIAEERVLDAAADWRRANAGGFDRVLVDVPCSGSGAWRRNPDAKWRLTEEELTRLCGQQDRLLDEAAELVAVGGRLVYATCSVLRCENERAVGAFLARDPRFTIMPLATVWPAILPEILQDAPPAREGFLELTPHRHGTDAFFAAILERGR